ncbi:Leucine rich repeat 5-containing protein [Strongyloides ratti]|uniref:Leucine rich repeat 5-containing protein n=1 Tax=Strongyloides ratti TaxID=34506 RepID=A0A090LKH7_STRRB|nr:Leucine rich repeat 5-containing protein [Strongyloides ratti]CEF68653.1 Leucine rich repeat 5-containing protein [Strongyloides ratti]
MKILFLVYFIRLLSIISSDSSCPDGCLCQDDEDLISCFGLNIDRIPSNWPAHYKKIHLIECDLTTIQKNAFRRWNQLEEIHIERNQKLDLIDKLAFKGLKKLREIHILHNPRITILLKSTFSSIQNEMGLNIHISNNSLEMIESGAFKNANNIRNLKIEEKCFILQEEALGSITQIDFIYLSGLCSINQFAFTNTSRVHSFNIFNSKFSILPKAFSFLNHVYQLSIYDNTITLISEDSFSNIKTIGTIKIEKNTIDVIKGRAFVGMENVGSIIISNNNIISSLSTPEILLIDPGSKIEFRENSVNCNCDIIWMDRWEDKSFAEENYCGPNEGRKSVFFYKPPDCHLVSQGDLISENDKSSIKVRDKESQFEHVQSSKLLTNYVTSGYYSIFHLNINLSLIIPSIFYIIFNVSRNF